MTQDSDQGMRANLNMDGNRIVKVQSPTHSRDAANKRYVDSVLSGVKPCISIWAERNEAFSGQYQFSFGGGSIGRDQRYCGYPMTTSGRILRMGLSATTNLGLAAAEMTVTLVVNGEPISGSHITKGSQTFTTVKTFNTPLELSLGDRLTFMSSRDAQGDPEAIAIVVTALIQLDL